MLIFEIFLQQANALSPILKTLFPNFTLDKFSQRKKASSPILVIVLGIVILFIEQLKKAPYLIVVTGTPLI